MHQWTRTQVATYALIAFIVVLIGARALRHDTRAGGANGASQAAAGSGIAGSARSASAASGHHAPARTPVGVTISRERLIVHVAGAVRHPGVYRLASGSRVVDAVRHAGGARAVADLDQVNLAARVSDGQQVLVPRRQALAAEAAPPSAPAGAAAASAPAMPVNLNTAGAEQLDTLDGVGPATIQKILAYRTEHGGFRSVDELGQIPGIGPKRLATLRPRVRV